MTRRPRYLLPLALAGATLISYYSIRNARARMATARNRKEG